ncbi:MAG: hypothetical protein J6Y71_05915 [Ruminococcus sp.]|nr:hypothetical protein [Ruminococcus sp.]
MKKIIAVLALISVAASAVSCGAKEDDTDIKKPNQPTTAAKVTEAETEAEKESEPETEEPTLSTEELQKIKDKDMAYLENIEVSLLDYYVGTPKEAAIDADDSDKATVITVGVNFNARNLDELDSMSLTMDGEKLHTNTVSTAWAAKDKDGELWGIYRFRIEGEYAQEDVKVRLWYADEYKVIREVNLDTESDFEPFMENMCWYEDSTSEEAVDGKIKHPYIFKINDRYCIYESYHETPPWGEEDEYGYYDQTYAITPLEGPFGAVLQEDDVEVKAENVKPFTYSKFISLRNSHVGQYVTCYICCKWDGVADWDNMTDAERMGTYNAQALYYKCVDLQSYITNLVIHNCEGGDFKISCAIPE